MSSYTDQISNLQKRILEHLLKCSTQTDTVSHIADSLDRSHQTVSKSVKFLVENYYLRADQHHKRGKKSLTLTQKGDALVVMLGTRFDELSEYIYRRRPEDTRAMEIYKSLFSSPKRQDFFLRLKMKYGLENDCFEKGVWKSLTDDEHRKFLRWGVAQYMNESTKLSEAGKYNTRKNFIDEAGLNKRLLSRYLNQYKLIIDSLINDVGEE